MCYANTIVDPQDGDIIEQEYRGDCAGEPSSASGSKEE